MKWKNKLIILVCFYFILSVYLTNYYKEKNGFYGFQDGINYVRFHDEFMTDKTHWLSIYLLDFFGYQFWPILLWVILTPFVLVKYYNSQGLEGCQKTFELYIYSPIMLLLLQENVYSQMLFTLFFVLYLTYKKTLFEVIGILAHPAFLILYIFEHFIERNFKKLTVIVIIGIMLYISNSNYQSYDIINTGGKRDYTKVIDVFFYMNPINIFYMPMTPYNIIYTLIGLFFHNGRFLVYALIIQYNNRIHKWAKFYGIILNLMILYNLMTVF